MWITTCKQINWKFEKVNKLNVNSKCKQNKEKFQDLN